MSTCELLHEGDVRIDVRVDGDGPALVLLPSSLRDSLDFDDVAARIAVAGFKVLRPQPRGMGKSQGPMEGLTLHDLAHDVAIAIERLAGGSAVVAGHAFGHYVARVLDLDRPWLVRGLAVLAGAAKAAPQGLSESLDIAADPEQPRERRLEHLRRVFFAPGSDPTPWLEGWHPHLRAVYRAAGNTPRKDRWWGVTNSPILDLQGACDPWRPLQTRYELRDALGRQRVTVGVIDHASHALLPEQPEAVVDALVRWMRTTMTGLEGGRG